MNRKRIIDVMLCSLSLAVIILSTTYIENGEIKKWMLLFFGILFLFFLCLAFFDSERKPYRGRTYRNGKVQALGLLDEEGNVIAEWNIGGKISVLIGRDTHRENVDVNLQNTAYGGMVDRQHAVLNYAGEQWYIEDLNSENGVQIQSGNDGQVYQLSPNHPCQINRGDILHIGCTRLEVK